MVDQPDFENMSPDEIMAWMETLAKRQGATEGFTTDADLDIPEIDPSTVVIDEPGYVPYSERSSGRTDEPAAPPAVSGPAAPPVMSPIAPPRPAPPSVVPPVSTPSTPAPRPLETPPPVAPRPATPPIMSPPPAAPKPAAPLPVAPPPPAARPPVPAWSAPVTKPAPEPEPQGSLAWLESLAQQNEDSLFNLDLSGLGDDTPEPAPSDPGAWLEAMAATPDLQAIAGETPEPEEDTDSLRWLESLARRQGAPTDELTTSADADVSAVRGEPEPPAYTPFSFNTAPTPPRSAPKAADPADFLGSLAASEGYSEAGVLATQEPEPAPVPGVAEDTEIEEIKRAISEGRVTPDQMQTFFERQVDFAETLPAGPDELETDEDAPPVPADLPDWLLEQVQVDQPPPPPAPPPGAPPLESLFAAPPPEIPDWLRDDSSDATADDLQGIFAPVESDELIESAIEVDVTDPWVEALDLEHTEGMAPVDAPPEWYLRNVSDPARMAAVEAGAAPLNDEPLPPEDALPAGEPQAVPDWITVAPAASEEPVVQAEAVDDVPEWLREMENVVASSEIPAWLNEPVEQTLSDDLPFTLEEAPPTPEFVIDPPTAPPELEAERAPDSSAAAPALESARQRRQSGDVAGALTEYEALIRANVALEDCVDDLAMVARLNRDNPVVFRVLGDGYMRLGKLQLALDTYREALNHL